MRDGSEFGRRRVGLVVLAWGARRVPLLVAAAAAEHGDGAAVAGRRGGVVGDGRGGFAGLPGHGGGYGLRGEGSEGRGGHEHDGQCTLAQMHLNSLIDW